jgi:hypothetical protein
MLAAEFFILLKLGLFIGCYDRSKITNTVPNNPAILKIQDAEACGMQVIIHSVAISIYSENYLYVQN